MKPIDETNIARVFEHIQKIRENPELDKLFVNLERAGELILIGGAVRDLCSAGENPRDLDIIMDGEGDLEEALREFPHQTNRFGGKKLSVCGVAFDIWPLKFHWAFRMGLAEPSQKNLSETIFYNFDAAFVNLSTGDWETSKFNEAAAKNELEIALSEEWAERNPVKTLNVVRALVLKKRFGASHGERLKAFLKKWFEETENPEQEIEKEQLRHYGKIIIDRTDTAFK